MLGAYDDVESVLAELEPQVSRQVPDNTLIMALEARSMVSLLSDPPAARVALEELVTVMSGHGIEHDSFMTLHLCSRHRWQPATSTPPSPMSTPLAASLTRRA